MTWRDIAAPAHSSGDAAVFAQILYHSRQLSAGVVALVKRDVAYIFARGAA